MRRDTRASTGGSIASRLADMTMREIENMPTARKREGESGAQWDRRGLADMTMRKIENMPTAWVSRRGDEGIELRLEGTPVCEVEHMPTAQGRREGRHQGSKRGLTHKTGEHAAQRRHRDDVLHPRQACKQGG